MLTLTLSPVVLLKFTLTVVFSADRLLSVLSRSKPVTASAEDVISTGETPGNAPKTKDAASAADVMPLMKRLLNVFFIAFFLS